MEKENRVCKLLNIKYPIILGGMAHVSKSKLAAAVCNCGGFGVIASGGMDPEDLEKEIVSLKEKTDKPFGVNLMLMDPDVEKKIEIVKEHSVDAVTTGAGNPSKYIDGLKEEGIKVFPVVPSSALAKRVERYGADGVIAEGTEAGGHVGEVTTLVLIPTVVKAVDIPVIAAGGVAESRGMAASLALGAEGVQIGTRFASSKESQMHQNYKEAIFKANERSTTVTGKSIRAPVRAIANKMTKKFSRLEEEGKSRDELEEVASGGLRRAVEEGDKNGGSLMAGQASSIIKEEKSVSEIFDELVSGTRKILKNPGF